MGRLWKKLTALLLAGVLTGCSAPAKEMQQLVERSLFAMNTYMTFTVYGEGKLVFLGDAQKESLGIQTKHWTLGVRYSKLILIYDKQRCRMG